MFNALLLSECHIINIQEYEKKKEFSEIQNQIANIKKNIK